MLKLSLLISLAGIIALFILTEVIDISSYSIAEAIETGGDVKITGTVKSIRTTNGVTILTVQDETGEIKAVDFNGKAQARKGEEIEIEGKVTEYMGEKEIEIRNTRIITD